MEGTAFTRPKPLLLLAYLAIEGAQERRRAAGLFWPQARDPLGSLTVALSQLRTGAPGAVQADRTHVWTRLPCDASQLLDSLQRASEDALELAARGPFLPGMSPVLLGVELEEWVFRTREFLALRLHRARLRHAEALAARGRWRDAAGHAEAAFPLVELAPEPEDLARLHTLLLAVGSDRAKHVRDEAFGFDLALAETGAAARGRLRDRARRRAPQEPRPRPLPRPTGVFLGRTAERDLLLRLLRQPRAIVALTGPAGVGKTRLALHVAHELADGGALDAGAAFVACAPLRTSDALPHAVADALGVELGPADDPLQRIADALGDRSCLLVCDEPEHLLAGASWLARCAEACPGLRVLVATRVRPNWDGVRVVALSGLGYPAADPADPAELSGAAAVRHFVRNAQRVRPTWEPTPGELRHVLRVCRAVEGLPLGLELAVAWLHVLPLEELAPAIEGDLDLLGAEAPDEDRSVAAALERSWRLLAPDDRRAMRRLAAVPGGFTRGTARAVAGATIPALARLVDASLLRCDEAGRFDRHPLVAAFVRRKAAERPDEARAAARALADHALDLVADAARTRDDGRVAEAYATLEAERELLWIAFEAADPAVRPDDLEDALDTLADMFEHRSRAEEGMALLRTWLERWCERGSPTRPCAHAQVGLARLARCAGAFADADRAGQAGLDLATRLGDDRSASAARQVLGVVALHRGAYDEAHQHLAAAVALAESDPDAVRRGLAAANQALASHLTGDRDGAIRGYESALRAFEEARDGRREARTATNLGLAYFEGGRLTDARHTWEKGLALAKRTANLRDALSLTSNLGMVHAALGDLDAAEDFDRHALAAAKDLGDARLEAAALARQAQVTHRRGRPREAEALARGAVELAWRAGEAPPTLAYLKVMADLWADGGARDRALDLYRFVADHPATPAAERAQAHAGAARLQGPGDPTEVADTPAVDEGGLAAVVTRVVGLVGV